MQLSALLWLPKTRGTLQGVSCSKTKLPWIAFLFIGIFYRYRRNCCLDFVQQQAMFLRHFTLVSLFGYFTLLCKDFWFCFLTFWIIWSTPWLSRIPLRQFAPNNLNLPPPMLNIVKLRWQRCSCSHCDTDLIITFLDTFRSVITALERDSSPWRWCHEALPAVTSLRRSQRG